MKKSKNASNKVVGVLQEPAQLDYPLQGSELDIPLAQVFALTPKQRQHFVDKLLRALAKEIRADTMALKRRVTLKREMRDLRALLYSPADQYLYTDDNTLKRNILGRGAPGSTHTYWSRHQMWKMKTKKGDLSQLITNRTPSLVAELCRFYDPDNPSMLKMRDSRSSAVLNALKHMQVNMGNGTAFPPFHARYFADLYLPRDQKGIVVDPCAGWGGRLLGTLCVRGRKDVAFYGIDPERNNKEAYEGLIRRVNIWLAKELDGKRAAKIYYKPFEDWLTSRAAQALYGKVHLVITSPPYFSAENYNPLNKKQSANRYNEYDSWKMHFYKPLIKGAFRLLKPGGHFVLNVANVAEARSLEADARRIAEAVGFERAGFYKLAMSVTPLHKTSGRLSHLISVHGATFKYEPVFVFRKPVRH